ncbi:hypothetical protein CIB48_g11582 [Xylaria polymorpha]|nr:hypothetical protein CIB48_g11582 [Xylaria polymorpha]
MTLTDPAIIGIVALLVTCIPGVRWLSRTIHRKLRSRQNNSSNRNTVLPLSDRSSPLFGPPEGVCIDPCVAYPIRATGQVTRMWMPPSPTIPGSEGFQLSGQQLTSHLAEAVDYCRIPVPSLNSE